MTEAPYRNDPQEAVAAAIDAAEEMKGPVTDEASPKPRLLVENCNPDVTVATVRDVLAEAGGYYNRGGPVRLAFDQSSEGRRRPNLDAAMD